MEISKHRYVGRMVGLMDWIGISYSNLCPDEYYSLSEKEREKYVKHGMCKGNFDTVLKRLSELTRGISEFYKPEDIINYKIGLREGMLIAKHNDNLMKLTLPISFWPK